MQFPHIQPGVQEKLYQSILQIVRTGAKSTESIIWNIKCVFIGKSIQAISTESKRISVIKLSIFSIMCFTFSISWNDKLCWHIWFQTCHSKIKSSNVNITHRSVDISKPPLLFTYNMTPHLFTQPPQKLIKIFVLYHMVFGYVWGLRNVSPSQHTHTLFLQLNVWHL